MTVERDTIEGSSWTVVLIRALLAAASAALRALLGRDRAPRA